MKLTDQTILITGGNSGIGLEFAKQLSKLGNRIIITGRDSTKLKEAQELIPGLEALQSDVSNLKEIGNLFATITRDFPETNILINNAGIMRNINLQSPGQSPEELTAEIETNLKGPIWMTETFLPHLKTKTSAAIVNVSSGLAFVPLPISPVYCATKAGLHSFTQSLRAQLRNTKIKVFELAPPATRTPLLGGHDSRDLKRVSIMPVDAMVRAAIAGMLSDRLEIRPGQSNQLKLMSRLAPEFILKQMSRTVDRMHGPNSTNS